MSELTLLRALLLLSLALAPWLTQRALLGGSRRAAVAHGVALLCAALGLFTAAAPLTGVWLAFCVASFAAYVWRVPPRSAPGLAACVPLTFSVIAATWLVGGSNHLRILGYGEAFSYYAALHGNVLGWMLVGAIAVLGAQDGPHQKVYLASTFVCLGSFLLVAIGIDSAPALKPIGVLGISLMVPIAQLAFLRDVHRKHGAAFALGLLSALGFALTMTLAWRNELGLAALPPVLGVRSMVSLHGLVNGAVVAPCFALAVALQPRHAGVGRV